MSLPTVRDYDKEREREREREKTWKSEPCIIARDYVSGSKDIHYVITARIEGGGIRDTMD